MTQTLFEINGLIDELMEQLVDPETGEINEEVYAALDQAEEDQEKKRDSRCFYIKQKKAEIKAMKEVLDDAADRYHAEQARLERITKRFEELMAGEKHKSAFNSVSYRRSESVVLDEGTDIYEVDALYLNYKEPELNKTAIKEALKNGAKVKGVHLESKTSMIIK